MTIVSFLLGLMIAIQFSGIKEAKPRDTRDVFQLQEDLTKEQQQHIELNNQLSQEDQLLQKYQDDDTNNKIETMKEALQQQKEAAGETKKTGKGVVLTIEPLVEGYFVEEDSLTADLIRRLINELNLLGATDIAISDERLTNTSPIRMVHDQVYINDRPLPQIPFTISVLTPTTSDFKKRIEVSESVEEFARNGLNITVTQKEHMQLPAYNDQQSIDFMTPVKEGE